MPSDRSTARYRSALEEIVKLGGKAADIAKQALTKTKSKRYLDLVGQRFGHTEVIFNGGSHELFTTSTDRSPKGRLWLCMCDCGTVHVAPTKSLIYGATRSCGCLRKRIARTQAKAAKWKRLMEKPAQNRRITAIPYPVRGRRAA